MAAYAALVSLINNIEQIKNHPRVSTMFDEEQLESLLQRVDSLLVFVESNNSYGGGEGETEDLERQITSAAHSAEDVIEFHIADQILPEDIIQLLPQSDTQFTRRLDPDPDHDVIVQSISNIQLEGLDLQEIIQDMDSVREKVVKAEEESGCKVELPAQSSMPVAASSRQQITAGKSKMVGFDGYLTQLLLKLTGDQPDQQIIPIVGMGGLGKTTLARNAYDSLPVVKHFILRAWVVISQTYVMRDILFETLSSLGKSKDEMDNKTEHELSQLLHQTLFNRRYLIVLDDMWSIEAWDRIKFYFPNNCNGSRILVTTRISDVKNHFGSPGLELNVLDDVHSWELFCDKVFLPHEDCPAELEESGKEIVKKCRGLPLAIVVIGGLLRSISRTRDRWENVEKDITSVLITANDNQCLKLLSLSYSHLPARLKPCYLYLGIFLEDEVIRVSRLIKLWVAEGFIKPNKDQLLEEVAESYIKDLVGRNLISVDSLRWSGKVKTIRIHDLLRDLCIRVAVKEKLFCVTSELEASQEVDRQRSVIVRGSTYVGYHSTLALDTLKSKSLARSLIFINQGRREVHVKSRLLRVLVANYCETRDVIFQQVNLRFLAEECRVQLGAVLIPYHLPPSFSQLWNVQTLIMTGVPGVVAPSEIWKMPQLRHLMFNFVILPEPPPSDDGIVLHNLQTLVRVENSRLSEEVCKRMPNIKKLKVRFGYSARDVGNFALFNKLESLHCEFYYSHSRENLLQFLKFPNSLKKLTLRCVPLQWEDLTVIGSLPHLEALIIDQSISGDCWDPVEGQFCSLRFLRIVDSDLECWNADDNHFPVLENLVLTYLSCLNEIPSEIGDIQALECISLIGCSVSAAVSAVKIQEEQKELWNRELQVKVKFSNERNLKRFKKNLKQSGLTGANLQIVDA